MVQTYRESEECPGCHACKKIDIARIYICKPAKQDECEGNKNHNKLQMPFAIEHGFFGNFSDRHADAVYAADAVIQPPVHSEARNEVNGKCDCKPYSVVVREYSLIQEYKGCWAGGHACYGKQAVSLLQPFERCEGVPWRMSPAVLMPLDSEERLRVVSRHADFMSSGFMSFVFRWWELESVRIQSVTIVWGEEPCPKMLREGM